MSEQSGQAGSLKSKGKVLRIRMGINPNSSGYGILWGAYFFLPPVAVSTLATVIMETRLRKALEDYLEDKASVIRKADLIVPLLWVLAWVGFFISWLDLVMEELSESYLLLAMSILAAIFISYLAWQYKDHQRMKKATINSTIVTFAFGIVLSILLALADAYLGLPQWIFLITYPFLLPLALTYTTQAAKLGLGISRIMLILAYSTLGFVLLIAFFPYVTVILSGSIDYNAVGLFFFLWGWAVPPLLTILSLTRMKSKSSENTESPV